jgi:hypothetical protein
MALQTMGDQAKAIADFNRVIELQPDLSAAFRARATAREAVGDKTGAAADRAKAQSLESPVGQDPGEPEPTQPQRARQ